MGMGDEILVTGEAKHLQEKDPQHRRVMVVDRFNRPRWHGLWEHNPRIVRPGHHTAGERTLRLQNSSHTRPYVDWEWMKAEFQEVFSGREFTTKGIRDSRLPWRFTKHKCKRGELFTKQLPKEDFIIIEPHNKVRVSPNRDWGFDRWQQVVDELPDLNWLQINPYGVKRLAGVSSRNAATFVRACEFMSSAKLYVGPEGGLYHAAAALGVPSVAIFGGFVSPENQGYDDCINLYEPMGGESPCGQRILCPHCEKALSMITVDKVVSSIKEML